jgi:hypothetical protein
MKRLLLNMVASTEQGTVHVMNLDKSTKRIAKRVGKGFQGYPQVSLTYSGESDACATGVIVGYISEEGAHGRKSKSFPARVMPEKTQPFKPHC